MAYIIGQDYGSSHTGTTVEFPDGDAALRAFYAKTYVEPGLIIKVTWDSGNPIPPEVVPTRARVLKGKGPYDWLNAGGPVLVSGRFRDCVETLDPGRHGFFPLTLEDATGVVRPEPYYLFNVVGRIDAIIEAKSNLTAVGRGQVANWAYTRRVGPWHCAVDRTVIGGRACWTDVRYSRRWFIDDRLANLLKKYRLSGFTLDCYCAELDPE